MYCSIAWYVRDVHSCIALHRRVWTDCKRWTRRDHSLTRWGSMIGHLSELSGTAQLKCWWMKSRYLPPALFALYCQAFTAVPKGKAFFVCNTWVTPTRSTEVKVGLAKVSGRSASLLANTFFLRHCAESKAWVGYKTGSNQQPGNNCTLTASIWKPLSLALICCLPVQQARVFASLWNRMTHLFVNTSSQNKHIVNNYCCTLILLYGFPPCKERDVCYC